MASRALVCCFLLKLTSALLACYQLNPNGSPHASMIDGNQQPLTVTCQNLKYPGMSTRSVPNNTRPKGSRKANAGDFPVRRLLVEDWRTRQTVPNHIYCYEVQSCLTGEVTAGQGIAHRQANYNSYGCSCKGYYSANKLSWWRLIFTGLGLGALLFIIIIVILAMLLSCHLYYQHCLQGGGEDPMRVSVASDGSCDDDHLVYVVHSPQCEQWVEHTLMCKLCQWKLHCTTYDLSAIPGRPKIVEKLRLCDAASKIIIVLARDAFTEDNFLNEVLQIISSEQAKVIPILCGVSEDQLQENIVYRSIVTYVSIQHSDNHFDDRLQQALSNH